MKHLSVLGLWSLAAAAPALAQAPTPAAAPAELPYRASATKVNDLVHTKLDVVDWGMATFTFANGIIATLEASWTINAPRKSGPSPKQNSVVRLEATFPD